MGSPATGTDELGQPGATFGGPRDYTVGESSDVVLKLYIVFYKYKQPGEKKPGPVRQFRIYAENAADARRLAAEQANYPDVEVLSVKPA